MNNMVALELPTDTQLPRLVIEELNARYLRIAKELANNGQSIATMADTKKPVVVVDTKAARLASPATDYVFATEWVEFDTGLTYIARGISPGKSTGLVWWYLSGNQRGTYALRPTGLGAFDAGLLYTVTDKARTLRWTGTVWEFAPWEVIPTGYISGFVADPGTGWHICDGSAGVVQLNANGSTSTITVKDFTTARYPKWGPTAAGAGAAVAPLITGDTGPGTAHTHGITVTVDPISASGGGGVAIGAGAASAAASGHTHPAPAATGSAANESAHTHPHGTLVNDALGEPLHYGLQAFQRI